MVRQFRKKEFEILVCIDLVCLGGFYETVQDGTGFCTIIGLDDYEVLPTESKWPYSLLSVIVIHRDVSVGKKLTEILFLMDAVRKCFTDGAVVGDLLVFRFYPLEVGIYSRQEMLLTLLFAI